MRVESVLCNEPGHQGEKCPFSSPRCWLCWLLVILASGKSPCTRDQKDLCLHRSSVVKSKGMGVRKLGWIPTQVLLEVYTCTMG